MKILLANKFYYRRGGDCVCTINLEELLKSHGHEVAIFAMQHPDTLPTPWSWYFPSEVKFKPGPGMIEAFLRPFGTREVKNKFNALLDDFQPDVVHLNNIHSQLSPLIAELAHQRGIKVVWTLHDYKLLCPRYDCLRDGKKACEECFTNKHKVLEYKCMKGSAVASLLAYKEAMKWNRERIEKCTDIYLCPSRFMANKMTEGGFSPDKIHKLCNFIDVEKCRKDSYSKEDYYCFIGRLSHEKGIKTLIESANSLPYKLVIIGGGPLEEEAKAQAGNKVEFVGFKQWEQIKEIGLLIMQDAVWNRVTANRSKHKTTWFYIDEFHLLLKGQTGSFSVEIWKRFRKWGGIPSGLTQNVKDLLASREIENIFENSDFIYMLNQAQGDRQILAKQLGISPHQLSYVTHSGPGEGLLFFGNVIIPFVDHFPKDTLLYSVLTTRPDEVAGTKA